MAAKRCIECGPGSRRVAKYPGPRCWSHHKQKQGTNKQARREKHVLETYGITEAEYQQIYEAQGGVCAGCRRAKGTGKYRLSVDHDHKLAEEHDHPNDKGCRECVRGLLCRSCNRDVLGHLRDEIDALYRFIEYLRNPPARDVLARLRT